MVKDRVSVIIPIFNTEIYLEKCINSIINQTYKNIEIILVNDGSTDNSDIICKRYKKIDNRIIYFKRQNKGVSSSRNYGISKATGEYIFFVDSDDFVENDIIETLYKNLKIYNADLAVCEYRNISEKKKVLDKAETLVSIFDQNGIQGYVWGKLYKSSIIKKNKISFDENIHICEDLLFNAKYIQYINLSIYDSKKLYYYLYRTSSAVNGIFNDKKLTVIDAYDEMEKLYCNYDNAIKDNFMCSFVLLNLNMKMTIKLCKYKNIEDEKRINTNISKNISKVLKSKYVGKTLRIKVFIKYYFFNIIYMLKYMLKNLRS